MLNKIISYIVLIVSIIGTFIASRNLSTPGSPLSLKENGVYFSNAYASNGSRVIVSPEGDGLNFELIPFNIVGDSETITYELTNASRDFDMEGQLLINGSKVSTNDYFLIECGDLGVIKKNGKKTSTIKITLIKQPDKEVNIPFNMDLNLEPVY